MAVFHADGKVPVSMLWFISRLSSKEIVGAAIFSILEPRPSDLAALRDGMCFNNSSMFFGVICEIVNCGLFTLSAVRSLMCLRGARINESDGRFRSSSRGCFTMIYFASIFFFTIYFYIYFACLYFVCLSPEIGTTSSLRAAKPSNITSFNYTIKIQVERLIVASERYLSKCWSTLENALGLFLKGPENFRARKAIRKTVTCMILFCKAGLYISCKGNKN